MSMYWRTADGTKKWRNNYLGVFLGSMPNSIMISFRRPSPSPIRAVSPPHQGGAPNESNSRILVLPLFARFRLIDFDSFPPINER